MSGSKSTRKTPSGGPTADPDLLLARLRAKERVIAAAKEWVAFRTQAESGRYSPTYGMRLEAELTEAVRVLSAT